MMKNNVQTSSLNLKIENERNLQDKKQKLYVYQIVKKRMELKMRMMKYEKGKVIYWCCCCFGLNYLKSG